ncbi:MAG TPA: hypothetical protein K8V35_08510 [Aliicoccus persicus]|mgnify:CR=1 FL=1|uniref:GRAM domain-containing protein n=1 Tax=Aliicoccus persicus TaxID=930138 RepID=A0A921DY62_9STAP|nr:hypothetical protein [Aliicoccus persicus]
MDLTQYGKPLHRGSANVWKRGEPVRGKLYLLEQALIHQQEGHHLRSDTFIIELKDIESVSFKNFLGFIPNGLLIKTMDGEAHSLVVNRRKNWKEKIDTQRQTLKQL